jgi:hypothetical protein
MFKLSSCIIDLPYKYFFTVQSTFTTYWLTCTEILFQQCCKIKRKNENVKSMFFTIFS